MNDKLYFFSDVYGNKSSFFKNCAALNLREHEKKGRPDENPNWHRFDKLDYQPFGGDEVFNKADTSRSFNRTN